MDKRSSVKPSDNHPKLADSWSLLPKSARLVQEYFVPLLYVSVLPTLLIQLGTISNNDFQAHTSRSFPGAIALLIGALWSLLSLAARYYVQLRATEDKPVHIAEAYRKTGGRILPMLGLMIIYSLLILGGLILLIVPGVIVIRRYFLAPYYLIDRNVSIKESMRLSAQATKPIAGYIWGVIGVSIALALAASFLGTIPFGIGVLASTLINLLYAFAPALRYREARRHRLA